MFWHLNLYTQKNIEAQVFDTLSGWAIQLIASSSTGNRTPVSAVRGRRLNRLTIEPYSYYSLTAPAVFISLYSILTCRVA